MSTVRAIRSNSNQNQGLHLVVNSLPGHSNFRPAAMRLFTMACFCAAIAGAHLLAGGEINTLWQAKPFFAVLGLTFMLATWHVGFRSAFTGYIGGLFGPASGRDESLDHFYGRIHRWAAIGASFYAILTLLRGIPNATDFGRFMALMTPAFYGYLYAAFLGVVLQRRNTNDKARWGAMDFVLPLACIGIAYFGVNFLNR